jgi:drug/metabolite transporter (DMT)-like permease
MIYLFLAVFCSGSIALILKYSESRNLNRMVVTTSNYVVATSVSLFFVIKENLFFRSPLSIDMFFSESEKLLTGGIFSESSSFIWAVLTGFFAGILYFLGFIYIQKSIKENGVGITGAFSKIGIFIPMILSMLFWKEFPGKIQWGGIFLAVFAIIIANYTPDIKNSLIKFRTSLVLVFFIVGMSEFSTKFFQNYAIMDYKSLFLFVVFLTAFFISLFFIVKNREQFSKKAVITGLLVGIPNMFTSFFLISSFKYLKTAVAFPAFSAGTIVFINIGGYFIFKEKIKGKDLTAIILTVLAVILMGGFN